MERSWQGFVHSSTRPFVHPFLVCHIACSAAPGTSSSGRGRWQGAASCPNLCLSLQGRTAGAWVLTSGQMILRCPPGSFTQVAPVTLKRQRRAGAGYRGPHHRDEPGGHAGGPPHSRPCSPLLGVPLLVSHSRRCIKTPTPQAAQWVAPGDGIGGWVRGRHRRDFEVGGEGSVVAALSLRLWPWSEAPESRGMVEGPRGHLS